METGTLLPKVLSPETPILLKQWPSKDKCSKRSKEDNEAGTRRMRMVNGHGRSSVKVVSYSLDCRSILQLVCSYRLGVDQPLEQALF